jgi:hypothetical protein
MGWSWACFVAQSLTVGAVFHSLAGDEDLGMPPGLTQHSRPAGLYKFMCGSERVVIAIIYDTVFVAVRSKELASKWRDRLVRNCKLLGITLKYAFVTRETTFSGIDLKHDGTRTVWRVAQETFQNWQTIGRDLRETPRALWRGMGFLHRWVEVQQRPRSCLGRLARLQATLARNNWQDVLQKWSPWWDQEASSSFLPMLKSMISQATNEWVSAHQGRSKRPRLRVRYFVVDATPECTAIVEFNDCGDVISQPPALPCECTNIDVAETIAITRASRLCDGGNCDLAVIGSDNTAASRAVFKGYSLSDEMDEYVGAPTCGKTIHVDIPTDANYADIPTRPDRVYSAAEIEFRRQNSFERLRRSYAAYSVWPQFYFLRNDRIFVGMQQAWTNDAGLTRWRAAEQLGE